MTADSLHNAMMVGGYGDASRRRPFDNALSIEIACAGHPVERYMMPYCV
ncbi:MAG: hypothetical protein JW736_04300 [Deltaproteobacteria bacterium]|nr:hypothetical protein [Deltaproteobacteria bacterium]